MTIYALALLATLATGPAVPQDATVPASAVQDRVEAPRPDRAANWLTVVYGGLVGSDLAITMACIADGTCREANPVLRPLSNHPVWYGAAKASLNTSLVLAVRHYTRPRSWPRYLGLSVLIIGQGAVVWLNAHRLGGVRHGQ